MTRKTHLFLLIPMLSLLASSARAQPIRVEARRFERQPASPLFNQGVRLNANVVLSGSAFHSMSGYGDWKISEARDDKGDDLRPTAKDDLAKNAIIQRFATSEEGRALGEPTTLFLAMPSPQATRVVRLSGTISIRTGGTPENISIPHIKGSYGQKLVSPALEAAGVQISVDPFDKDNPKSLRLGVRGDFAALQSGEHDDLQSGIGITDERGHNLKSYIFTSSADDGGEENVSVDAEQPFDDTMALHLRLMTHPQILVVPFALRDVPLPSFAQMKLDDALVQEGRGSGLSRGSMASNESEIKLLLARGADANARDSDGFTSLYWRARAGDDASIRLLLAHGANPNLTSYIRGSSPLGDASYFDHTQTALLLISHGADVNAAEYNGMTPLILAISHSDDRETKALLDAGANPNLQTDDSYEALTALMFAAQSNDVKQVKMLLTHRADPNIKNSNGETVLIMVSKQNLWRGKDDYLEVEQALLAHGANVHARDKSGHTALMWAKVRRNVSLIRLLKQAGAKE